MSNKPKKIQKRRQGRRTISFNPKKEQKLRATLASARLPLPVAQKVLDDVITALDEFEVPHPEDCSFCGVLAQEVEKVKNHAIRDGDSAERGIKQGLGVDLAVMHIMLVNDWARDFLLFCGSAKEAHVPGVVFSKQEQEPDGS